MASNISEIISLERVLEGAVLLTAIFFQEFIKDLAHSIKIGVGFKSNITQALFRDNKIDDVLREFIRSNQNVDSAVVEKITNGGGVPKEGSPLNSSITHPTEKKAEWPTSEVSPFFRTFIQRVYKEKMVMLPIEGIPIGDPSYAYLKNQKNKIPCIMVTLVKENRKCRYILNIRLTATPEEYYQDNKLREDIRKTVNEIKKQIG